MNPQKIVVLLLLIAQLLLLCCGSVGAEEADKLENQFEPQQVAIPDVNNAFNETLAFSANYTTSKLIEVQKGDVITFGPVLVTSSNWFLAPYQANGSKACDAVSFSHCTRVGMQYDGRDLTYFLSWTVPDNVRYIRMAAPATRTGEILLTVNQPYTLAEYKAYIAQARTPKNPDSVLNGKKALFVGDSLVFGSYDAAPPATGRSWWGRIAINTGLQAVGAGVGGATVAKCADAAGWIADQITDQASENYDIVVIEGGCNDARRSLPIGNMLHTEEKAELLENTNTFAGGLQWIIHQAKKNWPNAILFYTSTIHQDAHTTGSIKQSQDYYDIAEALCERYGVVYIDLYNNTELNSKLQSSTPKYLPDTLHPTSEGYDIIAPYVQAPIEATLQALLPPSDKETEDGGDATPSTGDTTQAEPQESGTVEGSSHPTQTSPSSGCASTLSGSLAAILMVAAAVACVQKKGRRAKCSRCLPPNS